IYSFFVQPADPVQQERGIYIERAFQLRKFLFQGQPQVPAVPRPLDSRNIRRVADHYVKTAHIMFKEAVGAYDAAPEISRTRHRILQVMHRCCSDAGACRHAFPGPGPGAIGPVTVPAPLKFGDEPVPEAEPGYLHRRLIDVGAMEAVCYRFISQHEGVVFKRTVPRMSAAIREVHGYCATELHYFIEHAAYE